MPDPALAFLTEVFAVLVANKRLPKYQFERRVDIFVNVFLADGWLARRAKECRPNRAK